MAAAMATSPGGFAWRTVSPCKSSVSVSRPSAMTASYSLGVPSRCGSSRVARPRSRTRSPVANGSSVPACPIRETPKARRATRTTSCDVMPAGLSTSRSPSVAASLIGWLDGLVRRSLRPGRGSHLREQLLDVRPVRDALVVAELDLRSNAKSERTSHASAKMRRHAGEAVECRRALRLRANDAHEDLRVLQIASHLDAGHRDQAVDARILDVVGEEEGDLLAHRRGDAIGAMMVWRHGSNLGKRTGAGRTSPNVGPRITRRRRQL